MEATIQSNQMDWDKEEKRPGPDLASLPQERHVWRIPELPPIPQGLAEPFPSGSHRNVSVQAQKLGQSSQGRGVGNILKPLGGGHELLLTHQELSVSGEDHRALRRVYPILLQRQDQKDEEFIEEPNSFIHRPEAGVGNDPSFGERRPSGVYQLQKCPKTSPKDLRRSRKLARAIKARAKPKPIGTKLTQKGTGSPNWNDWQWTVFSIWPELSWNSQPKSRKG
ncbi:hypothetical protein O181_043455 [Austropuccinia psidii MF-1]|uniref:Uncharacterized protein n=1 Tax=Austropuccinia psidii MF-1 TaxID=1389203 RepID=A0A9Q3HJ70_9BASI|nr:hypothetical protein [Austropuccinia psidii MF-1]